MNASRYAKNNQRRRIIRQGDRTGRDHHADNFRPDVVIAAATPASEPPPQPVIRA